MEKTEERKVGSKDTPLVIPSKVIARKAPDFKEVAPKAVAGLSEEELIERNAIGDTEEKEDEEKEAS